MYPMSFCALSTRFETVIGFVISDKSKIWKSWWKRFSIWVLIWIMKRSVTGAIRVKLWFSDKNVLWHVTSKIFFNSDECRSADENVVDNNVRVSDLLHIQWLMRTVDDPGSWWVYQAGACLNTQDMETKIRTLLQVVILLGEYIYFPLNIDDTQS